MVTVNLERVLDTARLELEPITPAHAGILYDYLTDDLLYRFHTGKPLSRQELATRFQRWLQRSSPDGAQNWLNYALKRKADGRYVGWIQATVQARNATIGYDIFVEFWRRGYAKEACRELIRLLFRDFQVAYISAKVDVENIASIRLLESLGFVQQWSGPSEDMPGRRDYRYELLDSRRSHRRSSCKR
jgi:[ribosomal protein S5]-alanine N-acetyltransferase